jgi:L-ascorbate metabolism protein UlaG (beta-lactamase superfamily)
MNGNAERHYLKQNVLAEPLINQWYAWPYLIPPATAAMYMANSHLKIMQSFLSNPQMHVTALKNPAMLGGPFINYPASRSGEIRKLFEETTRKHSRMIMLAEAIKSMNETLLNEATGHSLEPLYQKIPDGLKGYVELVYDLNNHPSLRLIERLLYGSDYYAESSQGLALSRADGDNRSFVFSTPRLKDGTHLQVDFPFSYEGFDELFKAKSQPGSLPRLMEMLDIKAEDSDLFSSFFTEAAPAPSPSYTGDGMKIGYFGHACLLIESGGTSILLDPVISYDVGKGMPRYTYADLPETINYILITHNHQDHCLFETLLQLRHKTENIIVPRSGGGDLADPSLKLILQKLGFKSVIEMDEMEVIRSGDVTITALPFYGEHADLNIKTKSAYLIAGAGKSVLCVADSNNLLPDIYGPVHEAVGDVDTLFLGMECDGGPLTWLYGPLLTRPLARKMDQSRRFDGSDCQKALGLVNVFNPKRAYVYAMGQEPWLTHLTSIQYTEASRPIVESNRFVEECRARGLVSERLFGCKEIV